MDFFNTYWSLIYGFAIKAGLSDAAAQDVVQETLVAVAAKMPGFEYDRDKGSFRSWLRNLTRWKVLDHLRKGRRERSHVVHTDQSKTRTQALEKIPDPAGFELEAVWDEEWEKNLLTMAIKRVRLKADAKQYQIFDLYVFKNWPAPKVAQTLGIELGQVYLAKHRVLKLIRSEIELLEQQEP